jgi:hypothetical protein
MTRLDHRRQREAVRERLAECRRELHHVLAASVPDATAILELSADARLRGCCDRCSCHGMTGVIAEAMLPAPS